MSCMQSLLEMDGFARNIKKRVECDLKYKVEYKVTQQGELQRSKAKLGRQKEVEAKVAEESLSKSTCKKNEGEMTL